MPTEIYYPSMPNIPAPPLCQSCYSRATRGGARYCKACAHPNQAAPTSTSSSGNLCKYCRQKPRYGRYDYCGKTCAERAGSGTNRSHSRSGSQSQSRSRSQSSSRSRSQPVPPLRIQVPAAVIAPKKKHSLGSFGDLITTVAKAAHVVPPSPEDSASENGVIRCMLPKCKQPVHVDKDGRVTGEYCSQSHREKAVDSGLASPCVMCLANPQRATDHFCGRACRQDALSKHRR